MCIYLTDDGEQCSMDAEPFCHHHDDSRQAKIYHVAQNGSESSVSGSSELHDAYHCDKCESAVRVALGSLSDTSSTTMYAIELVASCGCASAAIRRDVLGDSELPDEWL